MHDDIGSWYVFRLWGSSVTIGATPSPYILSITTGNDYPGSYGSIRYYFSVIGASENIPILMTYTARSSVDLINGAYGPHVQTHLDLTNLFNLTVGDFSLRYDYDSPVDITQTVAFNAYGHSGGRIDMSAGGYFDAHGQGAGGTISAFIDPVFTIEPTYAAAHPSARIDFSPGVGNSPIPAAGGAVPEPASWAMMIAGFGTAGAAMRRRRRIEVRARFA